MLSKSLKRSFVNNYYRLFINGRILLNLQNRYKIKDLKLYLRVFGESVVFAFQSVVANPLRSFLTLLSITIGILAIIGVLTAVSSLEISIRNSVSTLGEDQFYIQQSPWEAEADGKYRWWKYMRYPKITIKDFEALQAVGNIPAKMAFMASASTTVEYSDGFFNSSGKNVAVLLVSHDFYRTRSVQIGSGRYFTETESQRGKNVAIIGADLATSLFGSRNPLQKSIKVNGRKVKVIGVFAKEGGFIPGSSLDNNVAMPVSYGRNVFNLRSLDPSIMINAAEGFSNDRLKNMVKGRMRSIRRLRPTEEDNFAINESAFITQNFNTFFNRMEWIGFIIGIFAMVVGAFSIANIMFVTVRERTPMIGIRKSLGAKNSFILIQFFSEAIILSIMGGILGLLLVWGLMALLRVAVGMDFVLTSGNIMLGLMLTTAVGIVSGIFPALRAAKLDPVEAIRTNV